MGLATMPQASSPSGSEIREVQLLYLGRSQEVCVPLSGKVVVGVVTGMGVGLAKQCTCSRLGYT